MFQKTHHVVIFRTIGAVRTRLSDGLWFECYVSVQIIAWVSVYKLFSKQETRDMEGLIHM